MHSYVVFVVEAPHEHHTCDDKKQYEVSDVEDWTNKRLNKNNHVRKLILYDADADERFCLFMRH